MIDVLQYFDHFSGCQFNLRFVAPCPDTLFPSGAGFQLTVEYGRLRPGNLSRTLIRRCFQGSLVMESLYKVCSDCVMWCIRLVCLHVPGDSGSWSKCPGGLSKLFRTLAQFVKLLKFSNIRIIVSTIKFDGTLSVVYIVPKLA